MPYRVYIFANSFDIQKVDTPPDGKTVFARFAEARRYVVGYWKVKVHRYHKLEQQAWQMNADDYHLLDGEGLDG